MVTEVQVLHKLNHGHILKFHDWYETRNNLWLILEYCSGGDLESILRTDGHLPETSVRLFGLDIIAALKVNYCAFDVLFWNLHLSYISYSICILQE